MREIIKDLIVSIIGAFLGGFITIICFKYQENIRIKNSISLKKYEEFLKHVSAIRKDIDNQFILSESLFYKDAINFYDIRRFYDEIYNFIENKKFEDMIFFVKNNKIIFLDYIDQIDRIYKEYLKLIYKVNDEFELYEIYKISKYLNINEYNLDRNCVRILSELKKDTGVDFELYEIKQYDKRLTSRQIGKIIKSKINNRDDIDSDIYDQISYTMTYINNLFVYQREFKNGKYKELIEFNDKIFKMYIEILYEIKKLVYDINEEGYSKYYKKKDLKKCKPEDSINYFDRRDNRKLSDEEFYKKEEEKALKHFKKTFDEEVCKDILDYLKEIQKIGSKYNWEDDISEEEKDSIRKELELINEKFKDVSFNITI